MDATRFDAWTTAFAAAASRRAALRRLAGTALLGRLGSRGATAQEATVHWDHCRHVGQRCRRRQQCCSGRCRGRRGRKSCRAHHVGTCRPGQDICTQGGVASRCNGANDCWCLVTTGGARYCSTGFVCWDCQRDADCEAFGPGAACVEMAVGFCSCPESSGFGTACAVPCAPPA